MKRSFFMKYYYKGKYLELKHSMFKTKTMKTYIEIIPFNKNNFDVFSFMEFIDSITQEYVCWLSSYNGKITIRAKHYLFTGSEESFRINLHNDFSQIEVSVRDGLCNMKEEVMNNVNCICFTSFSLQEEQTKTFFYDNKSWNDNFQYKNSVLYKLGKFIAKNQTKTPFFLKYAFKGFLNEKTHNNKQIQNQFKDLMSLFLYLPGYTYIQYEDDIPISEKKWSTIEIECKKKVLTSFIWLMPWYEETLSQMHFLEIDASFFALEPYKYCIYHAITNNSSIPIALSFYPTESSELYNLIFECMKKFNLDLTIFDNIEVLADMGKQIKKFCKENDLNLNFCHRHIIERFGAHSPLGIWAARILRTRTYVEYLQTKERVKSELDEFILKKKKVSKINDKVQKKINNLMIMLSDPNDPEVDEEKIKNSNYFLGKWANWLRREKHICRCSNHSEGAHGNINSIIHSKGQRNVKKSLILIVNYILNYLHNREENCYHSFKTRHTNFLYQIRLFIFNKLDNYLKCGQKECFDCEETIYNKMIYGVDFPCHHSILYNYFIEEKLFDFKPENEFNVRRLFMFLLDKFPHNLYESEKFIKSKSEINKIVKDFIVSENLTNANLAHLQITAFAFLRCFCYTLPEFLNINPKDCKYNFSKFEKDISNYNFGQKENKKHVYDTDYVDDCGYDSDFAYHPSDTEEQRLMKKVFHETKREIKKLYPDLSKKAENICLHNFIHYLSNEKNINHDDLLKKLAIFKIECWAMADEEAESCLFMLGEF